MERPAYIRCTKDGMNVSLHLAGTPKDMIMMCHSILESVSDDTGIPVPVLCLEVADMGNKVKLARKTTIDMDKMRAAARQEGIHHTPTTEELEDIFRHEEKEP